MNWARIFNRLFEIINGQDGAYFSGGRFISSVREVDPHFPDHSQYIAERRRLGKSTSRKDFFYDILVSFDNEEDRTRLIGAILDQVSDLHPEKLSELRAELGGVAAVPPAKISPDSWNGERLILTVPPYSSMSECGRLSISGRFLCEHSGRFFTQ